MSRNFSTNFKTNLNLVTAKDLPIIALEITHPNLSQPVRIVNDAKDLQSLNNTYIACPFSMSILSDSDKERPKAVLSISNIGREMTRWIEQTQGGVGTEIKIKILRRDEPDNIEYEVTLSFTEITVTTQSIAGVLGFENLYRKTAINKFFTSKVAAGLHNSSLG